MRTLLFISILLTATSSFASRVDNFVLLDHRGDAHELYYHAGANAVVLYSQSASCAADANSTRQFNALVKHHAGDNVQFFMLNATPADDRAALTRAADQQGIEVPILNDETQLISASLGLEHTGALLVLNPKDWHIASNGSVAEGATALAALTGTEPAALNADSTGCAIQYPAPESVSYSADIAPLLQQKCVVCHTEGGLGPWAMSSYQMVLGFSPMIREVVRTKRMPPWHADPHIGVWKNDISLSVQQTQMLINWIESGSPRGEGPDPLAQNKTAAVEWPLGEPDLIVDIPEYAVPASGVVDYQFPRVKNPLDTGVWIKAATVVPGDREVVHHILAGTQDSDTSELRRSSGVFDNYLIGYAPGNESNEFPSNTGIYIPPGGEFSFQMHYTPVGRATVDRSKIGLYFHKEKPEQFYRQSVVIDPTITIPPNTARHAEVAYYTFEQEAMLHDLVPHAHYRGVASKFELEHADGRRETLLSVPNYDFNWQRTYEFVEPRRIPAGSRIVHTTWYDNSAANPGNPNPEREVPWGLQSWDEMLYGAFSFTYVDETTEAPIHDRIRSQTNQWVGFLDKNLDGKVSWRELPREMKKRLVQGFKAVDANGDGSLDLEEMYQLTLRQREARERREQESAGAR